MNNYTWILVALVGLYLLYGLLLYLFQERLMYFPSKQDFFECKRFDDTKKMVVGGTRLYFKNISDKIIVFYHGNAGSACDRAYLKDKFESMGYSSIIVEYSGFSNDKKLPNSNRILQDVRNTEKFLRDFHFKEIVVMGSSIGTGPACYHSSLKKTDKAILVSPFMRFSDLARKQYPIYPVRLLLRNNYDNDVWLNTEDLLIIHGEDDKIIKPVHSEKLYNKVNTHKKRCLIKGSGHNDIYHMQETWEKISDFLGVEKPGDVEPEEN